MCQGGLSPSLNPEKPPLFACPPVAPHGEPEKSVPTYLFKQYAIEKPIKEINRAGIGIEITPEGVRQGRRLVAIRFDCRQSPRAAMGKRRRAKAEPLPEPDSKTENLREEKELEHLKELYPEEFAELYEAELAKAPAFIPERFKRIAAEGSAFMQLKERHGIVK